MPARVTIQEAQHADQGKLGPLLIDILGPALAEETQAARQAGFEVAAVEDELMAADDFYFSSLELMDCCHFAWRGGVIVGAAAVNPYVAELQYVVVKPAHRRQGIGARLVKTALAALAARGVSHVKVDLSRGGSDFAGARAFLASLGFLPVKETVRLGMPLGE